MTEKRPLGKNDTKTPGSDVAAAMVSAFLVFKTIDSRCSGLLQLCSRINGAKCLTGAPAMGSIAICAILRHANLSDIGAMFIRFTYFFILFILVFDEKESIKSTPSRLGYRLR